LNVSEEVTISGTDLNEARTALGEAADRLAGLAISEKVQAYLMISTAWTEIARLQGQLEAAARETAREATVS
jgi:hypothetical protein